MVDLRYDFNNLMAERIGEHGVQETDLQELSFRIQSAADSVGKASLGFRKLPYNTELADQVATVASKIQNQYENFVVVGIGGSALGNIAVHSALNHPEYNLLPRPARRGPRLFVPDNIDPDRINALLDVIDLENTCFNVVTKSGGTAETMSEFLIFRDALIKKLGEKKQVEQVVLTTDPANGELRKIVNEFGYFSLPIPPDVGGRFSVLSAVGLLSAAVTGIDIHALLKGAAAVDGLCKETKELWENPALTGAALHYVMDVKKGKNVQVMMPYSHALRDVADWFRQLWAESLGKRMGRNGQVVNVGQTPEKAVGATDQHSVMQLYIEGPYDKVVTFLTVDEFRTTAEIPHAFEDYPSVSYLGGHTLNELINAEQLATELALTQSGKANCAIRLPRVNEQTVGALLYMLEMQTAYAGEFYDINAFDQPGVELGKNFTYGLMGKKGFEAKREEVEQGKKPNPQFVTRF